LDRALAASTPVSAMNFFCAERETSEKKENTGATKSLALFGSPTQDAAV
jgi:hypothetical protein